jgi:chromosome segregation ATPase
MLTARFPSSLVCLVLGFPVLTSCATKSDLEQLKQEIQASASKVETLKGETRTGFETTKKQLEEREMKLAQDLKSLQEAVVALTEAVKEQRTKLADNAAKEERLSKDAEELRALVQATAKTLIDFLRTEESQLKEGLRWVQSVLKGLTIEAKAGEGKTEGKTEEKAKEGQKESPPSGKAEEKSK